MPEVSQAQVPHQNNPNDLGHWICPPHYWRLDEMEYGTCRVCKEERNFRALRDGIRADLVERQLRGKVKSKRHVEKRPTVKAPNHRPALPQPKTGGKPAGGPHGRRRVQKDAHHPVQRWQGLDGHAGAGKRSH